MMTGTGLSHPERKGGGRAVRARPHHEGVKISSIVGINQTFELFCLLGSAQEVRRFHVVTPGFVRRAARLV